MGQTRAERIKMKAGSSKGNKGWDSDDSDDSDADKGPVSPNQFTPCSMFHFLSLSYHIGTTELSGIDANRITFIQLYYYTAVSFDS